MSFKIAIATSNGTHIDTDFAVAKKFLVVDVESDGTYKEEGYRTNPNLSNLTGSCSTGSCGGCGGCSSTQSVEFLWDCHYVLATGFDHKSTKLLNRIFIDALEVELPIKAAVFQVALYENRRSNNGNNKEYKSIYEPKAPIALEIPEVQTKKVIVASKENQNTSSNIKIAVASSDGKVINQHFGHATLFHIFSINGTEADFIESRDVNQCCANGHHSISAFEKVASVLSDCKAIVVAKIGEGASSFLEEKGFEVFEAPYLISAVLEKIIKEDLLGA